MKALSTLKKAAQRQTKAHGHHMRWQGAIARCRDCGKWVRIMCDPPFGHPQLEGRALAIDCESG